MSAEHQEFLDSARQVVSDFGIAADEAKTWPRLLELGWHLVLAPEELGGLGLDLPVACALYTELGRGLAGASYLPAMLALDAVSHSALADRGAWLERLGGGETLTAPLAGSEFKLAQLSLSGAAHGVQGADEGAHMLVCVGDIVALVPLRQATIQARPTWDRTRCLSDVHFTNVALDQALVLASGASAIALCERLAAHRDFALAADAVGGAAALLDMSVDYLRTRRQFGRPLAMFQALKHRCADLKVQVAAAEALLLDSLARFADQPGQAADLGRVAKQLACAVYARVAEEALQLHGGIAMSAEHNCHLYVKRALLNRQLGGSGYEAAIAASLLDAMTAIAGAMGATLDLGDDGK